MAEGNGLLNRRTWKRVPRVRIPPSPPFAFAANATQMPCIGDWRGRQNPALDILYAAGRVRSHKCCGLVA